MKNLLMLIFVAAGCALGYHLYIAPRMSSNASADNVESPEFKESVKRSQQAAVKAYPDLAQLNSKFNLRFRSRLGVWRKADDERLHHANWPEKLAKEIASQPAVISLDIGNGKMLYFNTMEQKSAYETAISRTRATAARTPPPPRHTDFSDSPLNSDSSLDSGRLKSGSTKSK